MSPRIGSRGCAGKGERYFADGLREFPDNRRLAILAVCAIGWQSGPLPDHAGLHRRRRQQQRVDDESRGTGVGLGRWSRAGARVRDRPLVGLPAGLRRAGGPHRRFPERSALAGRGVHGGRTVSLPPRRTVGPAQDAHLAPSQLRHEEGPGDSHRRGGHAQRRPDLTSTPWPRAGGEVTGPAGRPRSWSWTT